MCPSEERSLQYGAYLKFKRRNFIIRMNHNEGDFRQFLLLSESACAFAIDFPATHETFSINQKDKKIHSMGKASKDCGERVL